MLRFTFRVPLRRLDHRPAMLADLWRWRMDSDTVDSPWRK
jgi:hypothetical protein